MSSIAAALPSELLKLVIEEEDFSSACKKILSLPNGGKELPQSFVIPTLLLGDEFTIVKERLDNNFNGFLYEYSYSLYRLGHYQKVLSLLNDADDATLSGIQYLILKAQVLYRLNAFPSSLEFFQKALTFLHGEDPALREQILVNCEAIHANILDSVDHECRLEEAEWERLWNHAIRLKLLGREKELDKTIFFLRDATKSVEDEASVYGFIKELENNTVNVHFSDSGFRQSMTQKYCHLLKEFNAKSNAKSNNRLIKRNLFSLLNRIKGAGLSLKNDDPLYKNVYSLLYKQCSRMNSLQSLENWISSEEQ